MERKYQAYIQKLLSSDALRGDSIPTLDEYVKREMQGIGYEQIGEMYQIVHEHAKSCEQNGNINGALRMYEKAGLFVAAGDIALRHRMTDRAIEFYERSERYTAAAHVAKQAGNFEKAIEMCILESNFLTAISLLPNISEKNANSTDISQRVTGFKQAISSAEKAKETAISMAERFYTLSVQPCADQLDILRREANRTRDVITEAGWATMSYDPRFGWQVNAIPTSVRDEMGIISANTFHSFLNQCPANWMCDTGNYEAGIQKICVRYRYTLILEDRTAEKYREIQSKAELNLKEEIEQINKECTRMVDEICHNYNTLLKKKRIAQGKQ